MKPYQPLSEAEVGHRKHAAEALESCPRCWHLHTLLLVGFRALWVSD